MDWNLEIRHHGVILNHALTCESNRVGRFGIGSRVGKYSRFGIDDKNYRVKRVGRVGRVRRVGGASVVI